MQRGNQEPGERADETIHRTLRLTDMAFLVGGFAFSLFLFVVGLVLGCVVLYVAVAGKETSVLKIVGEGVAVACLVVAATAGAGLFGWGVGRHSLRLLKKERFVLGERRLQWVVGENELLGQFPYDNIADIRLKTLKSPNGSAYPVLGMNFVDPNRKDTFFVQDYAKGLAEQAGCDHVIVDLYDVPLKTFYKMLKKAWEEARSAH